MQRLTGKSSSWEIFSGLRARPPIVARADGRGFRKILEGCQKPYDLTFARSMASATVALFEESGLSPVLGFAFSDEISLLFLEVPFNGRIEKIDSVVASFISGALSLSLKRVVSLDCRVIPICETEVAMYLAERQDESWRNHIFSYGFFMLVREGLNHSEAMEQLRGMRESEIHELVFNRGVNLAKTPAWERRGVMVYRKDGRVVQDWELPLFRSEDGLRLLSDIIASAKAGSKKTDSGA